MNQRELKQQIRQGLIKNLYIFCGQDFLLKKIYARRIAKAKGFNLEKFTLYSEEEFESVNIKALSNTLFNKKGKVIYCTFQAPPSKQLKIKEPKTNILILDLEKCTIEQKNIVKFEKPTLKEIEEFLLFKAKSEGKSFHPKALDQLKEILKDKETSAIENTVNLIFLYTQDKKMVSLEDIERSVFDSSRFITKDLFKLLNTGSMEKLFDKIDDILKNIPLPLFIHILTDSFTKMYASHVLSEENFSSLFKGYFSSSKKLYESFGKERVKKILADLYEIDRLLKSSGTENLESIVKAKIVQWI